jgi:MFS family permease
MLSPLARALPAMTALQATVAFGVFSLSVLAPQLGISVAQLAALNTVLFGVGTVAALAAGRLIARLGDWQVAALCCAAVVAGMLCLLWGGAMAPWVAVLFFGLASGPETPASASVLSRLTPVARRPWIFSVRQTGNQIGAVAGSVTLPILLVVQPQLPYAVVAVVATGMALCLVWLSRDARLTGPPRIASATPLGMWAALRRVLQSKPLRMLAVAMLCYTSTQMCLNTFLMSLAVKEWQFGISAAAMLVAGLQGAGLLGRLFWGWVAQRRESSGRLLGWLGVLIAVVGLALMAWPVRHSGLALGLLVAMLGFCASGWNGVMVAEVSRIAGQHDTGAISGAVLMFGYVGITAAPLLYAALSGATSMAVAFMLLFAMSGCAGLALLLTRPASTHA